MYKVIIVEDDPMVAQINRGYVEQHSNFEVVGVFANGATALEFLQLNAIDLVILDMYMPKLDGLELLRTMRRLGIDVDVIMVTAANDPKQVDEMLRLGVLDYLVKPFTNSRFAEGIEKVLLRKRILAEDEVKQDAIDRLLGRRNAPIASVTLQKGIQQATLDLIMQAMCAAGNFLSCEDIALHTGLSKVTARRYLNHMVEEKIAESMIDYDTGGRPSVKYRCLN